MKVNSDKKYNNGSNFDYFNPSSGGMAHWQRLKIFIWRNHDDTDNSSDSICSICKTRVNKKSSYSDKKSKMIKENEDDLRKDCKHCCHEKCYKRLIATGLINNNQCILCKCD